MSLADLWAPGLLLAAFAGGAFGAAVGALPAFTFTGVMVIVGETYALLQRNLGPAGPAAAASEIAITSDIAFGVVLGPHISFGGGAAALAYAARRGYLDSEFDYHPAKEVTRGLGSRPDVLAVGGLFGIVGYWIATLSTTVSAPWDPVAMGVVLSAFAHRAVLGYSVIGRPVGRVLDMSPWERGERRSGDGFATDGGSVPDAAAGGDDRRYVVEPWLPYQYRWPNVVLLGVVVGVLAAYVAYVTGSAFMAFGLSVALLVFLNAGVASIPVTHHMSLPASTAVLAIVPGPLATLTPAAIAAAIPLWWALTVGGALGLVGALSGELIQRVCYAHAETHLDPPAASIVVTSFLIAGLAMLGVLPGSAWVPHP